MNAIHACHHSMAYRWVRASMLGTFWSHVDPKPNETLERAAIMRGVAALPGISGILSVMGFFALTASLFYGNVAFAGIFALFLAALHYPVPALALTPALLIWAPRLPVMVLGDELLFLRLDQAVIAGMVVACVLGRRATLRTPPTNTALLFFLLSIPLSIIVGIAQGTLTTPLSSLLYLAQWLTWYGLFVAAHSLGSRLGAFAVYAWTLPLIALAAYGLAEYVWPFYEVPGVRYRTFERGLFPGQANHAGGLLALATVTGLALATVPRHRILGLALTAFSTLALFPTGSRTSLLAWCGGVIALVLFYIPSLRWWMPPLALVGIFAIPSGTWYRFSAPGSSMYDRLIAWKSALSTLPDYPILGLGAGARHRSFYDNHYLMTLAESGMVGLVLLLLFLAVLARTLHQKHTGRVVQSQDTAAPLLPDPGTCWMAVGAFIGLVVLVIHGLATATFIVTLVAGPFFWLCGVALSDGEAPS